MSDNLITAPTVHLGISGVSSNEDFWRISKSDIVARDVKWRRPDHWLVVADEDIL